MKLRIEASKLRDAFNKVLTVIDKKSSRAILTNCLLNVEDRKVELIATDLEITAKILLFKMIF